MIAYVIKRKGARTYDARIRLGDERRITQVPLGCTNRQVAEKKLRELLDEREREAAGLIAPKVERDAANTCCRNGLLRVFNLEHLFVRLRRFRPSKRFQQGSHLGI